MSVSYAQTTHRNCQNCGRPLELQLWTIVDVEERPDLYRKIKDGSIHDKVCPYCNYRGQLDAPILVLQKKKTPHLIFATGKQTSEEVDRQFASLCITGLRERAGQDWRDFWLGDGVPGLPLELVPTALEEGLEAANLVILAHKQSVLERLSSEQREKFLELNAQARTLEEFIQLLEEEPDLMAALKGGRNEDK